MANAEFDVEHFERRLQALKDSQESIQGLSAWCLERRQHHKKIVATWLTVLRKVKVEHRLTLFYLANDVIQYSKRKNFEFVESWGTTLQRATTMVRDEKVKHRILRIFKIWDQRQVYDEEFLADLSGLLSAAPKKKPDPQPVAQPEEFQAALLISTMRSCSNLEQATDARLRDLRDGNVDIDNAEELCASLKDRRHVEDAEKEVDVAVRHVESYVKALEAEIRERTQVLDLLEQADQFYETQRGEVKIVTNAYRNFGSRVKNLKKKLDELLPTLISPIPSPDMDAPSPSPDSDIELPGDDVQTINQTTDSIVEIAPPSMYNSYGQDYDPTPVPAPELATGNSTSDFTNNFSSFMGGNVDFDMRNLFNDRSDTPSNGNQRYNDSTEAMPIEVINMRPSKGDQNTEDFSISNFLKTVLPSETGSVPDVADSPGIIPGLGLDAVDSRAESPQRLDYGILSGRMNTPPTMTGRMIVGPSTPQNSNQIVHSTPLALTRSLTSESHTPSPYSSQNSLSNMTTLPFIDSATVSSPVTPLPPPPLPPPIFLDEENCYNKLPPKFPTWTSANEVTKNDGKWDDKSKCSMNSTWIEDNEEKTKSQHWPETGIERWDTVNDGDWPSRIQGKNDVLSETPESPPIYEKSSFNTPIEYNDVDSRDPILSSDTDVDHRVRTIPMPSEMHLTHRLMKAADVDHRNLISLTGSPANNASNSNEAGISRPNNNNVWTSGDQNYRRQQGDIVESVDMEMSDEEGENKQKCRVLVDVRSQHDRDLRIPPCQPLQDLDMRMIPLPGNPMPRSGPMLQNIRPPPPPPLPPPQQQQQQQFRRPGHNDFQNSDFHQSQFVPDLRQNIQQQIFLSNQQQQHQQQQQDFHGISPNFHQNQAQKQMEFNQSRQHQDYDYHENMQKHSMMTSTVEFMGDSSLRGRFTIDNQSSEHQIQRQHQQHQQQHQQHHRESTVFHRNPNDRGCPRGRASFSRPRRDRFTDEQNPLQIRNLSNARRSSRPPEQSSLLEKSSLNLSNARGSLLLQPPDTCVILDDDGEPIIPPELDENPKSIAQKSRESENSKKSTTTKDNSLKCENAESSIVENSSNTLEIVNYKDATASLSFVDKTSNENLNDGGTKNSSDVAESSISGVIVGNCEKVGNEDLSKEVSSSRVDEPSRQLSEHLEALMNSGKITGSNDSKNQPANGNVVEQQQKLQLQQQQQQQQKEENSSTFSTQTTKRNSLANGPVLSTSSKDVDPAVIYEYDGSGNPVSNFRPRLPVIGTTVVTTATATTITSSISTSANSSVDGFPMWRGGGHPLRARGGFRGAPRAPWLDRGPRGPPVGGFIPRGKKRGGPFRGSGFRGRGRGGQGW